MMPKVRTTANQPGRERFTVAKAIAPLIDNKDHRIELGHHRPYHGNAKNAGFQSRRCGSCDTVATVGGCIFAVAFLNLITGLVFASLSGERIRSDGPFAAPAFTLVGLHASTVVVPVSLYLYVVHPEWAWMYFIDPNRVPGLAVIPLMAAHGALVFVGWFGGAWLQRRPDHRKAIRIGLAAGAAVTLLVTGLAWSRLSVSATYLGFAHKASVGLFVVELGYALLVTLLAVGASAGYVGIELSRDSRRARRL